MPTYKLRYGAVRGRIEPLRMMFAYKNHPMEVENIDLSDWPNQKKKQPFGQVPVMFIDGKPLCQTQAIARFVARDFGLAGSSEFESALCDMYVDGYYEMFNTITAAVIDSIQAGDFVKAKQQFAEKRDAVLTPFLDRYEQFLKDNGGQWLVADKISWADFALAEILQRYEEVFEPKLLENYPVLTAHRDRIFNLSGVKEYIANRPKMPY